MLTLIFILNLITLKVYGEDQWQSAARRLNGESNSVHKQMILNLKKVPALDEKLSTALGTSDHSLALEVISNLELFQFVDKLKYWAAKDGDGFSLLTLNSLIHAKNRRDILNFQKELLEKTAQLSSAQVKVILDFSGRAHFKISLKTLKKYFRLYPYLRGSLLIYRKQNGSIFRKGDFDFLNEGCFSCVEK